MFTSTPFIVQIITDLGLIIGVFVLRYLSYRFFLKKYDYKKAFLIPASIIYPAAFYLLWAEGVSTLVLSFGLSFLLVSVLLLVLDIVYLKILLKKPIKEFLKTTILINVIYIIIAVVFILSLMFIKVILIYNFEFTTTHFTK